MKFFTTTAIAFAGLTMVNGAGVNGIPSCAVKCFIQAVGKTSCAITDYYCQCTKGAKIIANSAFPCLCNDSTCDNAELMQVNKASEAICSSALSASGMKYTPTPIPSNVCAALSASNSASSNIPAATSASPTGGKATGTLASASSSSSPAAANAAAPTGAGIQGAAAAMGMGALAVLAL